MNSKNNGIVKCEVRYSSEHYHIESASSATSGFAMYPVRSTNIVLYHNSRLKKWAGKKTCIIPRCIRNFDMDNKYEA
jgi:hypothetical protein